MNTVDELLAAATAGDEAKVRALIAGGANLDDDSDYGWTALTRAAPKGRLEAARLLLKYAR